MNRAAIADAAGGQSGDGRDVVTALPGTGGSPEWVRVVRQVLDRIDNGQLAAGDVVPSIRELSAELEVSRSQVNLAMAYLSAQEVVQLGQGLRYLVSGDARERGTQAGRTVTGTGAS